MIKEIELFRPQKQIILAYVKKHGVEKISTYSATTFIPLIVIYTYIVEDIEELRELAEGKLVELKEFYDL